MYQLGTRSRANLLGVHPDLVRVLEEAVTNSPHDFTITEGVRSKTRQKMLVAEGKSWTMDSRHLTGHAVDLAIIKDGKAIWDKQPFEEVMLHIGAVAKLNDVAVKFGGHWKMQDWPHIELDKKVYP